jgi:arsenate reductase
MKILVLCTGNSCRSQMAEGFLKSFDNSFEVFSAGTKPEKALNPFAIKVMKEAGIDISFYYPKNVITFVNDSFDYVITVCNNAKESCPLFTGNVKNRLHIGFEDPADAKGTEEEVLKTYQRTRDEIKDEFYKFYLTIPKI